MAIKKSGNTNEIKYEIIEKCGVISRKNNGDTLELRYVSWSGRPPRYDVRPWFTNDDGTEGCGKGVTLSGEELERLGEIIKGMED